MPLVQMHAARPRLYSPAPHLYIQFIKIREGVKIVTRLGRRELMLTGAAAGANALQPTSSAMFSPAMAQENSGYYAGKRINVIVGYGTGGGFDVYARQVAKFLSRHVPGNPSATVQNMPGAGSLLAVNYLYNLAPKDGATIAHFGRNMILLGVLKDNPNVKFDTGKLTWLGSSSSFKDDAYILVVREDSPFKTVADVMRADGPRLLIGGSAEGSTSNDVPVILRDTINFQYKMVSGYTDSAALFLAMEKGETQARMVDLSGVRTMRREWLKPGGGYRVLLQFGRETRHPDLPDAPTARELAAGDAARSLIVASELPYKFSRPFAAPPGIPVERAALLQKAFMAVHEDPAFLEEAQRLGLDISPVGAEIVSQAVREIESSPPEVLNYLRKLFAAEKH